MVNKWINNILVMVYMDLFLRHTAVNTRNGIPERRFGFMRERFYSDRRKFPGAARGFKGGFRCGFKWSRFGRASHYRACLQKRRKEPERMSQ